MDESSPDIVKRLKRMPPFDDPQDETPVEETPAKEEVKEDVVEEPTKEPEVVEEETPIEEPQEEQEEVEEEITEEEALANSKNPERTKKYIESLKAKIPVPQPEPEKPKEHIPNAFDASEPEALVGMDFNFTPPPVVTPKDVANTTVYPNLSQKTIDEIIYSLFVTNENGEEVVDIDKLRGTLAQANRDVVTSQNNAQKALEKAETVERKFSDFEKTKEIREVHGDFPELDPESGQFNPKFYEVVKNEMVQQLIQKGKKDFKSAAQKWVDTFRTVRKEETEVTKKEKEKQNEVVNAKKQINATGAHSKAQQRNNWEDPVALANATRKGEKGALAERLRRSGL